MRFSVHGLEGNAFGAASEQRGWGDGMDGVGLVEFSDQEWSQPVYFQAFRWRRLVIVLHDSIRIMNTDGVVITENRLEPLAYPGPNAIENPILVPPFQPAITQIPLPFS